MDTTPTFLAASAETHYANADEALACLRDQLRTAYARGQRGHSVPAITLSPDHAASILFVCLDLARVIRGRAAGDRASS